MLYKVELKGVSPLLPHADDVELADALSAWRKAPENKNKSSAGDDRSPPWTWQTYCYTDGKFLTLPADCLMVCLRGAGSQLILKKQKTFKAETQSGMFIVEEHMPLIVNGKTIPVAELDKIKNKAFNEQAEAVQKLGFRLFVKRARVNNTKHVRVRARFDDWSVKGTVEVTSDSITQEILQQLLDIAGRQYGLCDWRPSSPKAPGPFGRFEAMVREAG